MARQYDITPVDPIGAATKGFQNYLSFNEQYQQGKEREARAKAAESDRQYTENVLRPRSEVQFNNALTDRERALQEHTEDRGYLLNSERPYQEKKRSWEEEQNRYETTTGRAMKEDLFENQLSASKLSQDATRQNMSQNAIKFSEGQLDRAREQDAMAKAEAIFQATAPGESREAALNGIPDKTVAARTREYLQQKDIQTVKQLEVAQHQLAQDAWVAKNIPLQEWQKYATYMQQKYPQLQNANLQASTPEELEQAKQQVFFVADAHARQIEYAKDKFSMQAGTKGMLTQDQKFDLLSKMRDEYLADPDAQGKKGGWFSADTPPKEFRSWLKTNRPDEYNAIYGSQGSQQSAENTDKNTTNQPDYAAMLLQKAKGNGNISEQKDEVYPKPLPGTAPVDIYAPGSPTARAQSSMNSLLQPMEGSSSLVGKGLETVIDPLVAARMKNKAYVQGQR